jgi:hypothetical protein
MTMVAELAVAEPTRQECENLHRLLGAVGLQRCETAETYRTARMRSDIGLSSLEVILLLVGYMEQRGLDTGDFSPDWVEFLDTVPGIIHVMALIDGSASRG